MRSALLTAAQEVALSKQAAAGDRRARERLITSNVGLVKQVAARYQKRTHLSFDDLVQEGYLGLATAVDMFDPSFGTRFSTYATPWIRSKILEAIVHAHSIFSVGASHYFRRTFFNLWRVKRDAEAAGRPADAAAMAEVLGVPEDIVRAAEALFSLSLSGGVDAGADSAEDIDDEDVVLERLTEERRLAVVKAAVLRLPEKWQVVVRMRFLQEEPATLRAIGQRLGVTHERIRQIQNLAVKRLQADCAPFRDFDDSSGDCDEGDEDVLTAAEMAG